MGGLVFRFVILVWYASRAAGIPWYHTPLPSYPGNLVPTKGEKCGVFGKPLTNCEPYPKCLVHTQVYMPCYKIVPPGGSCGGEFDRCEAPGKCTHKDGKDTCLVYVKSGEYCYKSGHVCTDGLICVGPKGREKCKTPRKLRERCLVDPYWVCDKGLHCVGPGDNPVTNVWKCKVPKEVNEVCLRDPYWKCRKGLHCVGPGDNPVKFVWKCKVPKEVNEVCLRDPYWKCRKGLHCVGPSDNPVKFVWKCKVPKMIGERCDDPYWRCKTGLMCVPEGNKRICRPSH